MAMVEDQIEVAARTNAGINFALNLIARLLVKLPREEEAMLISDAELSLIPEDLEDDPYLALYSAEIIQKAHFVQQLCSALRDTE